VIACKKHGFIGASTCVWNPDIGTTAKEMDIIYEAYKDLYGFTDMEHQACVTGKSPYNYGIKGKLQSGGKVVFFLLKHLLGQGGSKLEDKHARDIRKKSGLYRGVEDQKVIIQGYGTMGYWIAHYLNKNGARINGVCVDNCSIYNENG